MNHTDDLEYNIITRDIMNDEDFKGMEKIKHHNTNRLDHSLKVSYYSYTIAKFFHLDYASVARGGLLHDFYLERTVDYDKLKDKVKLYRKHSLDALDNSLEKFDLSLMEQDMIKCHMFPLDANIPKYAESWIVNTVDTFVSVYEFGQKFKYQLMYATNLYLLFFVNYIK